MTNHTTPGTSSEILRLCREKDPTEYRLVKLVQEIIERNVILESIPKIGRLRLTEEQRKQIRDLRSRHFQHRIK